MRTILVLSQQSDLCEEVRAAVSPGDIRIMECSSLGEAGPLLEHRIAEICIADLESISAAADELTFLERLCLTANHCAVIVYVAGKGPGWEAEAYQRGAAYVLTKPVQRRALAVILARLWGTARANASFETAQQQSSQQPEEAFSRVEKAQILKTVCGVFSHPLDSELMIRDFLSLLRDVFAIDRAAIFLPSRSGSSPRAFGAGAGRLRFTDGIGLSTALMKLIELSSETGMGGHLFRLGRIVRRSSQEIREDAVAQKEFELLGVQVSAAITDGESVLGIAALGGRITGEPLANSDLEIIFHLLQQLGLSIRNIWLHQEIEGNRQLLTEVVSELSSACVVISRDLVVLHSNAMAWKLFNDNKRPKGKLEFTDLPTLLGTKVHQVLMTGAAITGLRYEPTGSPGQALQVNIVPFQKEPGGLPGSALLLAEDITQRERLRVLEIEAANLRLVNNMAYRLTNEIRNATVSLVAHQQLLKERWNDAEFRTSMDGALAGTARRVRRLSDQMCFLNLECATSRETFDIVELIEEAFKNALLHQPSPKVQFQCNAPGSSVPITGDPIALKLALVEILINALQANLDNPQIEVHVQAASNGSHRSGIQIEVRDNGPGFSAESARQATEPFFTTRIVGSGLGLTVSRRIVESHGGKLELIPSQTGGGLVRITLPFGERFSEKRSESRF